MFVALTPVLIVNSLIGFYRNVSIPDAVFIHSVVQILHYVEKQPRQWTDLKFKQKTTEYLEEAANSAEKMLPRQLKSGDPATDLWLKETMIGIASALRAVKKWVLTPKADTRQQFLARISQTLVHTAKGDWDALPKEKPESINRPKVLLARVAELMRALFIGFLPLGILWTLQQTTLALQPSVSEYVTIAGVIWAILSFLAAIDPTYSGKISAMKDITSLLPGMGKGKS
jgi:hypothetical protein